MKRTAIAAILGSAYAFAHHSFQGSYFLDQQVTVHGKIAVLLFRNPHSYLELDVPAENGQVQRWSIEMGAMLPLSKRGIKPDTLQAGDEVTVTMSPPRNPPPGTHPRASSRSSFVPQTDSNGDAARRSSQGMG